MESSEQPQQPDQPGVEEPTSEQSPEATEGSPSESTEASPETASPSSDQAAESSEPSSESTPEPGPLAGTGSELESGTGGSGDHPAPAAMRDEAGELHSAGQSPAGTDAGEESPAGDASDVQDAGHALDPEAREELEAPNEPDQAETARPDLGTP